jgi:hypothetical protein
VTHVVGSRVTGGGSGLAIVEYVVEARPAPERATEQQWYQKQP